MELIVLLVFFVVPATFVYFVWLVHRWRRRESFARQGRCVQCGYDLRASSGRCPECGTAIASPEDNEAFGEADSAEANATHATPIKPRMPRGEEEMRCVFRTTSVLEAGILCERLQTAGIICSVEGERTVADSIYAEQRLMVWSDDVPRATEVLRFIRQRKENSRGRRR